MRKPLRHISSPRWYAARPHAQRCGGCSAVRALSLGGVSGRSCGHVLCIGLYTEAAMWVVRALGRPDMEGKQEAASVSFCSGCWPERSTPRKLSPLENGLQCRPIIFWVGAAGPINLCPVFSDTNRANRTGQQIESIRGFGHLQSLTGIVNVKKIVRRNYFCAGAEVTWERILYCLTAVPVFSTPDQASDDEAPRRCSSGGGFRYGPGVAIPAITSVQNGVTFHNFKFWLVNDSTSVAAWQHAVPAAGLRLSHPLNSAGAEKFFFSFKVSNSPSPELWTSASTVPGAGFLEFSSSAAGGAYDIRTDAVSPMNSSSVKLRHSAASVHFASPCLAATVLRTSPTCRKRQRLLPGPGVQFLGRAAWPYKSGKQHILTLRRPVLFCLVPVRSTLNFHQSFAGVRIGTGAEAHNLLPLIWVGVPPPGVCPAVRRHPKRFKQCDCRFAQSTHPVLFVALKGHERKSYLRSNQFVMVFVVPCKTFPASCCHHTVLSLCPTFKLTAYEKMNE